MWAWCHKCQEITAIANCVLPQTSNISQFQIQIKIIEYITITIELWRLQIKGQKRRKRRKIRGLRMMMNDACQSVAYYRQLIFLLHYQVELHLLYFHPFSMTAFGGNSRMKFCECNPLYDLCYFSTCLCRNCQISPWNLDGSAMKSML